MAQRTIDLLKEANEKLDENSTALANALPEDRNVKYYTGQYARILYSVYSYQAGSTEEAGEKETCYLNAVDALKEEAETYVELANASGNKDYYESAESVYESAESSMGTEDIAADIYVSHLNYLYTRYSEEYGSNPKQWKQEGMAKVQTVYNAGRKVSILAGRGNNEWNALIVNSAIAGIINGETAGNDSEG